MRKKFEKLLAEAFRREVTPHFSPSAVRKGDGGWPLDLGLIRADIQQELLGFDTYALVVVYATKYAKKRGLEVVYDKDKNCFTIRKAESKKHDKSTKKQSKKNG